MVTKNGFGQNKFHLKSVWKLIILLAIVNLKVQAIIDMRSKIGNTCKNDLECHYFPDGWEFC
jgi:hypothetical protein